MFRFLGFLGGMVGLSACSSGDILIAGVDVPADAAMVSDMAVSADLVVPPPPLPQANLIELRAVRWGGGGRELTIGVFEERTGRPFPDDLSSRIKVAPPDGVTVKLAVTRHTPAPGYTLLLLPPTGTRVEREARASAASAFVAARSPSERIALYANGAVVQRFSGFQLDRAELFEGLARYRDGTDDQGPLALPQAVSIAATELRGVGGEGPDVMRALVVLDGAAATVDAGDAGVFVTSAPANTIGALSASASIDEARNKGFYRVAACGPTDSFEGMVRVDGLRGSLDLTFASTLPEELAVACDPAMLDSANRKYTPRIEFVFDAAQRMAYDARVRATKAPQDLTLAKSDFQLQLRIAPGQPTVTATAHLRGQSSLTCERKGYALKIDGPSRYLLPDSASDEYLLVSMCDDPAYVFAPTVYDLVTDDLFSIKHRYVELILDGKTRGIYILMEKTREELVRDDTRVTTVMRREYPANGRDAFEIDWFSGGDPTGALDRWIDFENRIAPLQGDPLLTALRDQLDLDQYLRLLADESVLQSGDYIDEAYFIGSQRADGRGGVSESYRVMHWDPEGYTACHQNGSLAYPDPLKIAYCAEARLDHKILADRKVYALYVAKVEEAMKGRMARDRMQAALAKTVSELQALLMDPAVCAAMVELRNFNAMSADCAVARMVVANRATTIQSGYDARVSFLLGSLKAYHQANP